MTRYLALLILAGALSGCMQIDVNIKVDEDGSTTVTERLSVSRQLLESDTIAATDKGRIVDRLNKTSALERVKCMGKGARLVRHELRRKDDGDQESVAVYHIPRLEDLQFVSPYLALPEHQKGYIKFKFWPSYFRHWCGHWNADRPGWMGVNVGGYNLRGTRPKPPEALTPAQLQAYRELIPVFKDLVKGLRLRMTFELYGTLKTIDYMGSRHLKSRTFELLDFHPDRQRDSSGKLLVDNEEIMLDVIREDWASQRIQDLVKDFWRKDQVPIWRPKGRGGSIWVVPSRYHWMRYFQGYPRKFICDPGVTSQNKWLRMEEEMRKQEEKEKTK